MNKEQHHIQYSIGDIERYRKGEMSPADMHALESQALDDPFLADALEGYLSGAAKQPAADIDHLKQRLSTRIQKENRSKVIAFGWWKVAAVLLVLAGGSWLYVAVTGKRFTHDVAANKTVSDSSILTSPQAAAESLPSSDSQAVAKNNSAGIKNAPLAEDKAINERDVATEKPKRDHAVIPSSPQAIIDEKEPGKAISDRRKEEDQAATASAKPMERPETYNASSFGKKTDARVAQDTTLQSTLLNSLATKTFSGTVLDEQNRPLVNANIQIPNLNVATVTNKNGYFSFRAPDSALSVSIASVGYQTQNLDLVTDEVEDANKIIRLKPSLDALNEVVIADKAQKKKAMQAVTIRLLDAEPAIGWASYEDYLVKNKKVPGSVADIHGEVEVAFTVDRYNKMKNIHVAKSVHPVLDVEAVRLVSTGPSWTLLKGKKAAVSVTVKF